MSGNKKNKIQFRTIAIIGASILLFSSICFGLLISIQLRRVTNTENDFFHEGILNQSSALNRVIFAAAEYQDFHSNNQNEKGWLEGKIESCRKIISHASIPPFIAPDIYSSYISDDPLFLMERIKTTEDTYKKQHQNLIEIFEGIQASKTDSGKRSHLAQFDKSFYEFYSVLKERSSVMTMLEATYHAQLRTNFSWTGQVIDLILAGQAVAVLASLIVIFSSYHSQSKHLLVLKGLIPICAKCKKIRDDKGYWSQVEIYIHNHSEADFSHGICPDCIKDIYPEYVKIKNDEQSAKQK